MPKPDPATVAWVDQTDAAVQERLNREIAAVRKHLDRATRLTRPERLIYVNVVLSRASPEPDILLTLFSAALIRLAELPTSNPAQPEAE